MAALKPVCAVSDATVSLGTKVSLQRLRPGPWPRRAAPDRSSRPRRRAASPTAACHAVTCSRWITSPATVLLERGKLIRICDGTRLAGDDHRKSHPAAPNLHVSRKNNMQERFTLTKHEDCPISGSARSQPGKPRSRTDNPSQQPLGTQRLPDAGLSSDTPHSDNLETLRLNRSDQDK